MIFDLLLFIVMVMVKDMIRVLEVSKKSVCSSKLDFNVFDVDGGYKSLSCCSSFVLIGCCSAGDMHLLCSN